MSKFKLGFIFCFWIVPILCNSQTLPGRKSIDSLLVIVKTARQDTFQLNALHQLGRYYLLRRFRANTPDLDSASGYFNEEVTLGEKTGVKEGSGWPEGLCSLGEVSLAKSQFAQGKNCFMQVLDYYNKAGNKKMAGKTLVRFGKTAAETVWSDRPANLLKEIMAAYEAAIALFAASGAPGDEISVYTNMAANHFIYGQFDDAEADCLRAMRKYPAKLHPEFIRLYYVFAHIQRYRGNFNKALSYSLESLRLMEAQRRANADTTMQSLLFGEIALVYDALGQTENSIVWYKKTLSLRENMRIKLEFKYRTAGFIAQGLIKQKKFNEAFNVVLGVEKRHPPDNSYNKAIISQIKAYCYDAAGNYKKAEELYLLALKLFGSVKTDEIVSLAKYDAAKFYIRRGEYKKAAFYFDEGVWRGMAVTRLKDWHFISYKLDSAKGNYLSALQHHIQFKMFNDSIFNTEKNKQIQELQVQYETAQKERDILSLKKESAFQHEKTVQANNIRNLTLVGAALLVVLLVLIFSNYRAKQRSNIALNALVNEKDNLLQEKEWLMKEIHHRVKNNLQIVMGLLQRQSSFVNNKEALTAIRNSEHRMHSIALIHQKLYQSESFAMVGMGDYIDEMIGYLQESFDLGTRIRFEKDIDEIELEINIAVPLGLVLNEAITNAIKYAFPTHEKGCISVSLKKAGDNCYSLQIADDGRGLPDDFDIKRTNSMGFNLMRGLSKQLGGVFEVANNDGVTITIKMANV